MSRFHTVVPLLVLAACASGDDKPDGDDSNGGTTPDTDACPVAVWDPTELTWTDLVAGAATDLTVTVLNDCDGTSALSLQASVDDNAFAVDPGLASADPAGVATFTVTATLSDYAGATGTLTIATNDAANPTISLPLTASLDPDQDGDGQDWPDDCDDADATVNADAAEVWYDGVDQDCDGNDDDQDGDGFAVGDDCDDTDAAVNPDAAEAWYDGVDQDCDNNDDDQDGDGYAVDTDCDDTDAAVFPGATETWYDGVDGDCAGDGDYDADGDGQDASAWGGTDCDDTDVTVYLGAADAWYDGVDGDCTGDSDYDADQDGYDASAYGGDDCDDTDAGTSPGAAEVWYDGIDEDCDGASDYDQDGDGSAAFAYGGSDCADTDATTTAGVDETRNGLDDDCDGSVDEGLVAAGDIVITEVMTNPAAVSDTYGEWFELYNPGSYDVDLSGWIVYADDGSSMTISSSVTVPAGGYAVLGVEDDTTLNGGVTVDYQYSRVSFGLSDTDSIYLVAGSTTVAELAFDASTWPITEGYAMSLDPDETGAATSASSWCPATSTYGDGDHGTPGAANDLCSGIDHDGDGYSVDDGDCDDADASLSPAETEVSDGSDNDCDGVVDVPDEIDVTTLPYVSGLGLGDYTYAVATGDMDGDGDEDVVFPSLGGTPDAVYVLDGAGYASWAGDVDTYASATIDASWTDNVGASQRIGDNTGDGLADVVVAWNPTSSTDDTHWSLYASPSGSETASTAEITCTGTDAVVALGQLVTDVDFDGDGVAEVVYGNYADPELSGSYGGRVGIFDVSATSGSITLGDADLTLKDTRSGNWFGQYTAAGDVDDDGYADLVVQDYTSIHVIPGDGLATTGTLAYSTLQSVQIDDSPGNLALVVDDFDGDGSADVFGSAQRAYTHLAGFSGTIDSTDATTDFTSVAPLSCYRYDARLDLDRDGLGDMPIYCWETAWDGWDYTWTYSNLFLNDDALAAATADQDDAFFAVTFSGAGGYSYLRFDEDLDGDGDDELLVTDYGADEEGYTYVVDR